MTQHNTTQHNTTNYCALYNDAFYEYNAHEKHLISAYRVIDIVKEYVPIKSVIDIGCGVGNMLKACSESGAQIIRGVDGEWVNPKMLVIPRECFTPSDITQPDLAKKIPEKFDLTISTEVAEHIHEEYSSVYLDNLVSFSDVILFTAAVPGTGGTDHVNEQWLSYWVSRFRKRGFVLVNCLRPRLWEDKKIVWFYRQNLVFFVREECLKNYPALEAEAGRPCIVDVVHPEKWQDKIDSTRPALHVMRFRQAVKTVFSDIAYLVPSFIRALKRRLFPPKD